MVDVRLIQAAVTLAEVLNFSRAAQQLGLTQSALSKQIEKLEDQVGIPLFERSSQMVTVLEAGAAFVEHARIALFSIDRAVHTARASALGSDHVIMIGKSPNIDPFISSIMQAIRLPLFPGLQLRFSSHYSGESLNLLRAGAIDLAVVIGFEEEVGVSAVRLSEDPFFVAMLSTDPLCAKKEVRLSDFANRSLALFERQVNPAVLDRMQRALSDDRVHPTEVQYFIQAEEAAALVMQRESLALLTKAGAWRISDHVITIRPLRDDRLILRTFLAGRFEEKSRLVAEFLKATVKRVSPPSRQVPLRLAV